jgi:hypothetical protein
MEAAGEISARLGHGHGVLPHRIARSDASGNSDLAGAGKTPDFNRRGSARSSRAEFGGVEAEVIGRGSGHEADGVTLRGAGCKFQVDHVVIDRQCADLGAVVVTEVVPGPTGSDRGSPKQGVISDHRPFDASDPGAGQGLDEGLEGIQVGVGWEKSCGPGEVAPAQDDQIPQEGAVGADDSAWDEVGADPVSGPELVEGEGCGEQFSAGRRFEQFVGVGLEEGGIVLETCDADSPGGRRELRLGEVVLELSGEGSGKGGGIRRGTFCGESLGQPGER